MHEYIAALVTLNEPIPLLGVKLFHDTRFVFIHKTLSFPISNVPRLLANQFSSDWFLTADLLEYHLAGRC